MRQHVLGSERQWGFDVIMSMVRGDAPKQQLRVAQQRVAETAIHEVLSKVIRYKELLDVQHLSLPLQQADLELNVQRLVTELQQLQQDAVPNRSKMFQAAGIALQALELTHNTLAKSTMQLKPSSPDLQQQVQLCIQRLHQIADSNAAEDLAVSKRCATMPSLQQHTHDIKLKLPALALAKSNEQVVQHMAELNLRGVIDNIEVQSSLVKRELIEAKQELKSVQTRVAKLQRDCDSVHIPESQLKGSGQDGACASMSFSSMQENLVNTKADVEKLQRQIATLEKQIIGPHKTGIDLADQEQHGQLTAQLKGMRDKQTAAQAVLDDLDTEHTHLQEAYAIRARQREEVKLLEAELMSIKEAQADTDKHPWHISSGNSWHGPPQGHLAGHSEADLASSSPSADHAAGEPVSAKTNCTPVWQPLLFPEETESMAELQLQGPFSAAKTRQCVRSNLQVPLRVDCIAEGPAEERHLANLQVWDTNLVASVLT